MIIIFATAGDLYVFTEPSFDTKKECMEFYDKQQWSSLDEKLLQVYGYPKKYKQSTV